MSGVDDALSDVLMPVRLRGVFHSRWLARAPWAIRGEDENCAVVHYVLRNECRVGFSGGSASVTLREGDLAVFPHGTGHVIADSSSALDRPLDAVLPDRRPGTSGILELGGPDGAETELICAGLHQDAVGGLPVYQALPELILLDRAAVQRETLLARTLASITAESARRDPGARLIVTRAFELVFVLALRAELERLTDSASGLRALRHPGVGKALLAIYREFPEPWTVDSLSRRAGMSRSAFAKTFRELVGEAPGQHLAGHRMRAAARLLAETRVPQSAIPQLIGYQSAVGFHLAFRKEFGVPPGEFRRSAR